MHLSCFAFFCCFLRHSQPLNSWPSSSLSLSSTGITGVHRPACPPSDTDPCPAVSRPPWGLLGLLMAPGSLCYILHVSLKYPHWGNRPGLGVPHLTSPHRLGPPLSLGFPI